MDAEFLTSKYQFILYQRNALLAIALLLCMSVIVLSICVLKKSERIIITPPVLEKEFWVDAHRVSPSYMEQFSIYLASIMLTKSEHSAEAQRKAVMRHVAVDVAEKINSRLLLEEKKLKDEKASFVFFPVDVQVDVNTLKAVLTGDRTTYLSGQAVSTKRETYELAFSCKGARLLLTAMTYKGVGE
jgi:conjugal transfer pilus assembly protein TraE